MLHVEEPFVSDENNPSPPPPPPPRPRTKTRLVAALKAPAKPLTLVPTLQIVDGPGIGAIRRFKPDSENSLTVGRTTDAEFVIDHPTVSSLHARFTWSRDGEQFRLLVEDQESTNGTSINQKPVIGGVVKDGDLVGLGEVILRFQLLSSGELNERDRLIAKATNADIDPLTGLGTRRYMEDQIPRLFAECDARQLALSLLVLDLDHFKKVNDSLGHQAGDAVLRSFGATILKQVRAADTAVRYGGEEVLVFLTNTPHDGAQLVAERLRRSVEAIDVTSISPTLKVTVSVGLATRDPGEDFKSLMNRADSAVYRAKAGGRNRVELDPPPGGAATASAAPVTPPPPSTPAAEVAPRKSWWQFWK